MSRDFTRSSSSDQKYSFQYSSKHSSCSDKLYMEYLHKEKVKKMEASLEDKDKEIWKLKYSLDCKTRKIIELEYIIQEKNAFIFEIVEKKDKLTQKNDRNRNKLTERSDTVQRPRSQTTYTFEKEIEKLQEKEPLKKNEEILRRQISESEDKLIEAINRNEELNKEIQEITKKHNDIVPAYNLLNERLKESESNKDAWKETLSKNEQMIKELDRELRLNKDKLNTSLINSCNKELLEENKQLKRELILLKEPKNDRARREQTSLDNTKLTSQEAQSEIYALRKKVFELERKNETVKRMMEPPRDFVTTRIDQLESELSFIKMQALEGKNKREKLRHEVTELTNENLELKTTKEAFMDQIRQLSSEIERHERRNDELKIKSSELDLRATSDHEKIDSLEKELAEMKEEFHNISTLNNSEIKGLRDENKQLRISLDAIRDENTQLKNNLKEYNRSTGRNANHLTTDLRSLPSPKLSETGREVDALQMEVIQLKSALTDKDAELSKKQNALNVMKEKIKALSGDIDANMLTQLRHQNAANLKQLQDTTEEVEKLKKANKELSDKLALLAKNNNSLQNEMENMKKLNFQKTTDTAEVSQYVAQKPQVVVVKPPNIPTELLQKIPHWWHAHMK